jgi:hypothetical protein
VQYRKSAKQSAADGSLASTLLKPLPVLPQGATMRIRVTRIPSARDVDGIRLDRFVPSMVYEVGNTLGGLFLAEGWAELVPSDEPALVIPIDEIAPDAPVGQLIRDICAPYYDGGPALRRHQPHKSRRLISSAGRRP